VCTTPILIQANAGTPIKQGEQTIFPLAPEPFAHAAVELVTAGALLVGG
jgi:methionine synthase I (cobalamin-dependent)